MRDPLLIFTADNHLDPLTWVDYPEIYGDTYRSFEHIVNAAKIYELPLLLLGDLFDKVKPDSNSLHVYLNETKKLAETQVYYIEGNHDKAGLPWASLSDYATHASNLSFPDIHIKAIDFVHKTKLRDALLSDVKYDLLLTHQSWQEIQGIGTSTDAAFSDIPFGCVMLAGDCHINGQFTGQAENGDNIVAYSPGSSSLRSFKEQEDKYFGILYDDLTVKWERIPTRAVYNFSIRNIDDAHAIDIDAIKNKDITVTGKPLVRVTYNPDISGVFSYLTELFQDVAHLFLRTKKSQDVVVIDYDSAVNDAFSNLSSAISSLTAEEADTQLQSTADNLLRAEDIELALSNCTADMLSELLST